MLGLGGLELCAIPSTMAAETRGGGALRFAWAGPLGTCETALI